MTMKMSAASSNIGNSSKYSWLYSDIATIKEELRVRREDLALTKKLEEFWIGIEPSFIDTNSQYAVFSRPVATPNIEMACFIDIMQSLPLNPLILEFPDKFVSKSAEKRFLGKLCIFDTVPDGRAPTHRFKTIIDFSKWDGKPLASIRTNADQSLIEFHHNLFQQTFSEPSIPIIDFTDWFSRARHAFDEYYLAYLSLFIQNGVLFENFLAGNDAEEMFIQDKVLPSVARIEEIFGLKPLIYPVLPLHEEGDRRWLGYRDTVVRGDSELNMSTEVT